MTMNDATPIQELQCSPSCIPEQIYSSNQPVVLRGLVSEWPLVKKSLVSNQSAVAYLNQFYNGQAVNAFMAKPEANGRIFYNESVDGFNFVQSKVYLDDMLEKLLDISEQTAQATYYVGSLAIEQHLPRFAHENRLVLEQDLLSQSIWLGNRSVIAPHFDFPDNLACCVIGERKFTLFPPEQQENLYIGPLDFTPAGQPISMVNIQEPDLQTYPKFANAMLSAKTTILAPGDAIFIPSMWWHSVESLSALNGLVNYWWRNTPAYLGVPTNALLHAMLSIRHLPKSQREAWQNMFNNYVFDPPSDIYEHLPDQVRQKQSDMTEIIAHKIRAHLITKLK
ncbi:cupin-like domain-containing protein [Brumicola nitratireducens]|uniref:Pass1-related protein n=1 Tax=Glaciecola nitratireducens (strain JCM 12485 / KCTC 12276 / FR1064) TaxID=1085623 RepID=G4QE44_GLANF|nr:cupin-like domain-containing protein [Glaciecola nitratireducens]AEP31318.1 Pass1-related protein [Glaciecola nitratireducens FR1064]